MRCDDSELRGLLERVEAKMDAFHFLLADYARATARAHDHPVLDVDDLVVPHAPPSFCSVHFDAMPDEIITFPCQRNVNLCRTSTLTSL